jgi:Purine catabolism regulatory protein-like family
VLAGREGLDRTVTWAHSSDLPDPWDWLAGGELLMKNGRTLPRPAPGQAALLDSLATAGVSALVIGTDPDTPPITARMLAVADEHSLPLMRVPYSVSFIAVSRAVADASLRDESARLARAERIYAAIHAAAAGVDPAAFVARLEREIGGRLWVLDAGTGMPVLDGTEPPGEPLRMALLAALARRGGAVPGVLRLPGGVAVEVPYEEPTLLIAQPGRGEPVDLALLQHAAMAAAVEVAHTSLRQSHQRQLGAALFAQLLDSRLDPAAAERQLAAHGIAAARAQLLATRGAGDESQRLLHIGLRRRRIGHLLLRRGPVFLMLLDSPDGAELPVDLVAGRLGAATAVGVSNALGTPLRVPDAGRVPGLPAVLAGHRPGTQRAPADRHLPDAPGGRADRADAHRNGRHRRAVAGPVRAGSAHRRVPAPTWRGRIERPGPLVSFRRKGACHARLRAHVSLLRARRTALTSTSAAERFQGILARTAPRAQVLEMAATARPAPMAPTIHFTRGRSVLPATLAATTEPATRRTWRSRSHVWRPRVTGAPARSQLFMPPSRTRRPGSPT